MFAFINKTLPLKMKAKAGFAENPYATIPIEISSPILSID